MICPDCKGHGETWQHTPGMGPGSGDIGYAQTCLTCKGLRTVPSTQDLMERIDKVEAIVRAIAKDRRIQVDGL